MASETKIAFFGGTFDPVHIGHLHLATLAKDSLGLDQVRFLPCQISPHKPGSKPAGGDDRLEMLRRATANLPWAVVDDFEIIQTTGPSFSYLTAETMALRHPSARRFWIMGGDQWDSLPRWKHPERLSACMEFIVLARGNSPQPRPGFRLHVVEGQHPASSSAIRGAISNGQKNHPWLPAGVADWIESRKIYQPSIATDGAS
jgi:nicotinate-nucleotide adenylyltransferase